MNWSALDRTPDRKWTLLIFMFVILIVNFGLASKVSKMLLLFILEQEN